VLLELLLVGIEAICRAIGRLALVAVLYLFGLWLGRFPSNAADGRRGGDVCHVDEVRLSEEDGFAKSGTRPQR
jgi:hypothetical protein